MERTMIGTVGTFGSLAALFGFGATRGGRSPGAGAARAAVRLHQHRTQQAARVAPALPAMAEKRAELCRRRVARWKRSVWPKDLDQAPGHIKRMSREQKVRR